MEDGAAGVGSRYPPAANVVVSAARGLWPRMNPTGSFAAELRAQLRSAEQRNLMYVDINSGELHRRVGGYPGADHRMPSCCRAMQDEMRGTDEVRSSPPSGAGASLTIRYRLPR